MFRVVTAKKVDQNHRIFYMMQNATVNDSLFNHNLNYRDNGTIPIGSYLAIINSNPIERYM